MASKEIWTDEQTYEDYQAAEHFLGFTYDPKDASEIVDRMRAAPVVYHYGADALRVAGLPVLGESNVHVVRVLDEYYRGKLLTPVLIVRGSGGGRLFFAVADGYYRICAGVYLDELVKVPCRMVPKEAPKPQPAPEPAEVQADTAPVDGPPRRTPAAPRIYG